jgi:hypothetical protein
MTSDTYHLHGRLAPLGPIYSMASRRAEKAARRGDVVAAAAWLAIADRHLAMVERIDRGHIARARQAAHRAEAPYRLKALEQRTRVPR